ncbi:recombinase family protein [Microbacterium sp. Leaf179]|uniref:recombinase family protein n=1 Tax=Microbacterium sp. Leaf179 TaxID=1736288 RepID=UPI0006FFBD2D|nr:recombinase family protein [Microbacterium sp. Leaf179]KQR86508.1 hypothetical protein ASF96_09085 [Microbacterium sp. Leaf179]
MTPRKTTPRAAIYVRQSVAEPEGIQRQLAACRALAESRDYVVVAVYEDDNVSGYKARGEGTAFGRMLDDARAGRFDVLIVRKLDRLGRSLSALESLTAARVNTVTTDGALDLASPSGRLVANVLTSVSRAESEIKAERRVFANADRRTKGVPTSGRVPYGYQWVPTSERGDGDAYITDPSRAGDVLAVFDDFLAGVPLGSIARELNAKGRRTVPTKRHPEGVPFTPTTLRRMLMSPYYAALLPLPAEDGAQQPYDQRSISRETCVPGRWQAIVSVEAWEEARARLEHPERKTSPGPSRKWLLSGLAVCGTEGCGLPIRAGGGEAGIHSYRCASMAHFMRRGDPLDDFVQRVVIARLSRPDAADLLEDRERHDVEEIRAERRRLETAIRQAGDDEMDGLIDRAERVRLIRRANGRVAELDEKLRAGVDTSALADIVTAEDVGAAWHALSLGKKRGVLEALATVVVFSVGQGNRRRMSDEAMARTVRFDWHR